MIVLDQFTKRFGAQTAVDALYGANTPLREIMASPRVQICLWKLY